MATVTYLALRFWAILRKEFIIISRDLRTYIFLIVIPFSEVILFGYIINTDAKHLPTVIIANDNSQITNSIIKGFENTGYFTIKKITRDENEASKLLRSHRVQFILNIPYHFTRDLIRNNQPHILVEGDASDPIAVGNAFHAAQTLPNYALFRDFQGPLDYLNSDNSNFVVDTHAVYNPGIIAQYHTLPGLIMAVLTLTLVMLTAISITSEFEQGTMEILLITPAKPFDIILGKIVPNLVLGYILLILSVIISHYLFHVPFYGSVLLLFIAALPFFIANLGVGLAASAISKSQFQAANTANTYTLPAIFFSGFMFPFLGMPPWAQWLGSLLPTTHFLQITTNIMLKGATFTEIWEDIWPILIFVGVILTISYKYYRNTLD